MSDLFKKLNTLVKSRINDLLSDSAARLRNLSPGQLGGGMDAEIALLRRRINETLAYEDDLQARVQALRDEVVRWDQQADDALSRGQDAHARHAVEQMQRAQQRLTMAESDLKAHQLVTQELMQRVNMLESATADARRNQEEGQQETTVAGEESVVRPLGDMLRDTREKLANLSRAKDEVTGSKSTDEQAVDDDLAERRQRLSKPKS